jgi:predicted RND superfamily exporter protein
MATRSWQRQAVAALLVIVAITMVGLGLTKVRVDTGTDSFVPRGDRSYGDLQERDDDFGADPVVVLLRGTGSSGLLVDPDQLNRLVGLEGALSRLPDVAVVYGPGTVLNQTATSVRNVLAQISGNRDALENTARARAKAMGLSPAATEKAVAKALAAFDQRYGALFTSALPMGLPTLRNPKFVASVLFDQAGDPRPEWRFLVPTAKSATLLVRPRANLDQAATARLVRAVRATVDEAGLETTAPVITGVPVLTSAVSGKAGDEAPRVGLLALLGVGLVFLLLPWSRRRRDRLRPLLPAALGTATTVAAFGWADRPLSLGVVAFLPIVLGIGSDFPLYLAQPTERRRVLVAAAGGALAFATLGISELPFVREFGLALAVGIVATVAWAVVFRARLPEVEPARVEHQRSNRALPRSATRAVAVAGVAVAVSGWLMVPGLTIESSPQELAEGLPQLEDVATAEQALGFSGEISIVVRGDNVLSPEVLSWSDRAETAIVRAEGDDLRPLLTIGRLLDFLGSSATSEQVAAGADLLPPYLLNAVVTGDGSAASSTFGVELRDLDDQAELIERVRGLLPPEPDGYDVQVVGLPVAAASGLEAISASRYVIGVAALAAATLAVGIGLRSWRLALDVALVSALAAGWVYVAVRLTGGELNPLTLAVGALVTVTACEFTVMLDAARRQRRPWLRRSVGVAATAGTIGYLCLTTSDLAVLSSFGLVLACGVASSYVAARLVTALRSSAPLPGSTVHDETALDERLEPSQHSNTPVRATVKEPAS